MTRMFVRSLFAMLLSLLLAACGGGSGSSSPAAAAQPGGGAPAPLSSPPGAGATVPQSNTPNVFAIHVDGAPTNTHNIVQTSVTICVPGTNACQTIDDIQVDTGSQGLRILASALDPSIALPLVQSGTGNGVIAECYVFGSGYTWGAVRQADVRMAGQTAASTSVQLIAAGAPTDCASSSLPMLGTASLRGNGSPFAADCGAGCASSVVPRWYYACGGRSCAGTALPVAQQVTNPVANFPADNNGVLNGVLIDRAARRARERRFIGDGDDDVRHWLAGEQPARLRDRPAIEHGDGLRDDEFRRREPVELHRQRFERPVLSVSDARRHRRRERRRQLRCGVVDDAVRQRQFRARRSRGHGERLLRLGLPFFYGRRIFTALEDRATPAGVATCYAF